MYPSRKSLAFMRWGLAGGVIISSLIWAIILIHDAHVSMFDSCVQGTFDSPMHSNCSKNPTSHIQAWAGFDARDYCSSASTGADYPLFDEWISCPQLAKVQIDGNIILTSVNCGYVEFAINFWNAYQKLGYSNVIVISSDCATYTALVSLIGYDHVAKPLFPPATRVAQSFDSLDWGKIVTRRPVYMKYVLQAGYNVLWQDADSVPIKDVLQVLPPSLPMQFDVILTNDSLVGHPEQLCSCFLYMMHNRTGSHWLLDRWKLHVQGSGHDQPALNHALEDALNVTEYGSAEFEHMVLPQRMFPNGAQWDSYNHTAFWGHANFRVGKDAKLEFMKTRNLWSVPPEMIEKEACK